MWPHYALDFARCENTSLQISTLIFHRTHVTSHVSFSIFLFLRVNKYSLVIEVDVGHQPIVILNHRSLADDERPIAHHGCFPEAPGSCVERHDV